MKSKAKTKNERVITVLAEMNPDAWIDEAASAHIFGRCVKSIKRAVRRGELPPPVKQVGKLMWTVRAVLDHMNRRLEKAKQEAERLERRISQLNP